MDSRRALTALIAVSAVVAAGIPAAASAHRPPKLPEAHELASFAAPDCMSGCGSGSTVGPDRALYVTDGPGGRVLRVDPRTGTVTPFATGLPPAIPEIGIGGAMDVAFAGHRAYVLVTVVGPAVGQPGVVNGLYRIERNGSATPVADIGAWSVDNPPKTDFFVASGVQYAMQEYGGGFLVTDGHHNRVLHVTRRGRDPRADRVRQHRPHGPRGPWLDDLHGPGRPNPASPAGRQGREVHAVVRSDGGCVWGQPDRRRRARARITGCTPCHRASGICRRSRRTRVRRHRRTRGGSCVSAGTAGSRPCSSPWTGRRRSSSSARPPS